MGRGVPEILSAAIKDNFVILDLRYAVVYRAATAALLLSGGTNG